MGPIKGLQPGCCWELAAALRAPLVLKSGHGCGLRRRSRVAVADAGHEMGPIKGLQRGCCWELAAALFEPLVLKSGHGCGLRRRRGHGCGLRRRSRVAVADAWQCGGNADPARRGQRKWGFESVVGWPTVLPNVGCWGV